ncbi:PQQ-dependent sugar dehydrogenase [Tuwongella immobilis]|uniref:Cytochrome c domain-containing protein n=1 Tax=Tuwongella immobilis TaxID=692036 RepID=A0A6C2YTV1_9BACT|nr:PQQ-dependent sugar dehydrogenase [Tuwongella immobilis]VIP04459.1 glucose sorbosone dehydrogenase : Uncharacterized protein OS=Isosphaera pallida (strain ATCC 43644 / DSM 9630 / IS1B) GN=Isop_1748 PE=4 SV=1: DUF1083: GSDH [Tuwongella immobilis]VTS06280.1 glucose sorbosone dehydrogenase : Uncharacterized protein OS=Isosphaera pallida (strain ATCC 43644 / DSM 9630 / IS1B) GN=Isop_1748 PE=4 SV=1: DUF1083: GSDH [Tuwongella immobilis]
MNRLSLRGLALALSGLGMLAVMLLGLGRGATTSLAADAPLPAPLTTTPPSAFECRWCDPPPQVDGKATDAVWKDAQRIDTFYLPWLKDKARPARTTTNAKLLWDREYLYFLAEMQDSDLYADVKEHDGITWDNDVFELFFKPAKDKPGYYEFQVNPLGTVMDLFLPRRNSGGFTRFKSDGQFHIDAKVSLDGTLNRWNDRDKSWTVEGRIPWRDFLRTGGRPEPGESWQFALCRYDYSVDFEGPELSTCAPLQSKSVPDFHAYEDYATLTFTGPTKTGSQSKPYGIASYQPVTTSTVKGSPEPPSPYRTQRVYPQLPMDFPIHLVHQPGSDRMLVIHQPKPYGTTTISRFRDNPAVKELEPLLELTDTAYDLVFHPKFAENGYFYVGSNGSKGSAPKQTRVTRYTMERQEPYRVDPKSATEIIAWDSDGHNGAAIAFGNDGTLFVTSGDGTSDSDTNLVGQVPGTLLAKVLRIDVDHPEPGKQYAVPKDNPYVNRPEFRPETWAYGMRNPWRMTFDRISNQLWVGQNGQDMWEQAYLVTKGANYGWSVTEGGHPFYPERKAGPTPILKPTIEHHHSDFRSLTGGVVYRGSKYPDLVGAYIYGDYSTGKIWGMKHDGTQVIWHRELFDSTLQITGFSLDARGELLINDHRGGGQGGFYTLVPTPKDLPASTFPKKLSESGLFDSVAGHKLKPGVIPYTVNAPFWSDGAYKVRAFALPPGGKIEYNRKRAWGFPNDTVIVKSFALEMVEGDPNSRKWIETRFMTKQDGEWFGYSYRWNDAQTDAELVASAGQDASFAIRAGDGMREQKWHYPSRAECMVCHSRAAGFVLGLCEVQMNCTNDYNGVVDSQLRTLEHLDLFTVKSQQDLRDWLVEQAQAKGATEADARKAMEAEFASRDQRTMAATSSLLPLPLTEYRKLVNPFDDQQPLTLRAKSYLHANCASCHVEAGGGNAAMELEFTTALEKMRIVDEKPRHATFDLPDARLIAPGAPERSVLLHRISHRQSGHMPPLSTSVVDAKANALLREWIRSLPATPKPAEKPAGK